MTQVETTQRQFIASIFKCETLWVISRSTTIRFRNQLSLMVRRTVFSPIWRRRWVRIMQCARDTRLFALIQDRSASQRILANRWTYPLQQWRIFLTGACRDGDAASSIFVSRVQLEDARHELLNCTFRSINCRLRLASSSKPYRFFAAAVWVRFSLRRCLSLIR